MADSPEWEWFDAQMLHLDGRATGGEPCVICGEPIAPGAHWKQRDRHVCSVRCNRVLRRRVRRKIDRGELTIPTPSPPARPAHGIAFRTDRSAEFPFEFLGWGPVVGDVVERDGSVIAYLPRGVEELNGTPRPVVFCLHLNTGSVAVRSLDESGHIERIAWAQVTAEGEPVHLGRPFSVGGIEWVWCTEFINDVDAEGQEYRWEAPVCVPAGQPPIYWTPARQQLSDDRRRTTASTGGHARRERIYGGQATVERIDPLQVFNRDHWHCQLCDVEVDPSLRHPDPMSASLDHRIPLVAGGRHVMANVQLAHLRCNLRKGGRTDVSLP